MKGKKKKKKKKLKGGEQKELINRTRVRENYKARVGMEKRN